MASLNGTTFGFIMGEVMQERHSQEEKKEQGKFKYTLSDPDCSPLVASVCMQEEIGEVARGVLVLEGLANDDSTLEDLEQEVDHPNEQ